MSNTLYYCEAKRKGLLYRLEIQPACTCTSGVIDAITTSVRFNESALLEIGDLEWEYDGLPTVIGAGAMKFKIDISQLPAGLKTVLKQPIGSVEEALYSANNAICPWYTEDLADGIITNNLDVCNVWTLWSWDGSAWELEFTGGQSKTVEREYQVYRDGREIAEYTITDIVSCVLQRTPMYQVAGQFYAFYATSDYTPVTTNEIIDVFWTGLTGNLLGKSDKPNTNPPQYAHMVKYETLQTAIQNCAGTVLQVLVRDYTATFDITGTPTSHWTFFKNDYTQSAEKHEKGSALTDANLRFAGFITKNNSTMPYSDANIIGGHLVKDKDGATLLENQYVWDLYKRWCGCFIGKMTTRLWHTGHTSGHFAHNVYFNHPFENENAVAVATLDPDESLENPYSIIDGADCLRSAKFQNLFTSDRDIAELTREQPGSLADKNETVEALFTNSPTQPEVWEYRGFSPVNEDLFHPNKLCYYEPSPTASPYGDIVYKVHESCEIADPYGAQYEIVQDNVKDFYDNVTYFQFQNDTAKGWVTEAQLNNNAGVAALQAMLKWFANYNQVQRELLFPLAGSDKASAIGRVYNAAPPAGYNCQTPGVCTKIQISFTDGTIRYTLFHRQAL